MSAAVIRFATTKRGERLAHFTIPENRRALVEYMGFHTPTFWASLRIPDNHARRCHAELLARFLINQGLPVVVGEDPPPHPADDSPGFGFDPVQGKLLCQEAIPDAVRKRRVPKR